MTHVIYMSHGSEPQALYLVSPHLLNVCEDLVGISQKYLWITDHCILFFDVSTQKFKTQDTEKESLRIFIIYKYLLLCWRYLLLSKSTI